MSTQASAAALGVYAISREDPCRPAVIGPDGFTTTFGELTLRSP
jgi:hypothetical protein